MKKILLTTTAIGLFSAGLMAQGSLNIAKPTKKGKTPTSAQANAGNGGGTKYNRCGTIKPSEAWDAEFNQQVQAYIQAHAADIANGKVAATSYTIPIIYHVIHGGQAVGTYPNIAQGQINSQTQVLNADYGGTGAYTSNYNALTSGGHGPFYDYANGNSLPAPDNTTSGVKVANCGITFCMATKDPSGNTLAEPGIDRVNYTTKGWSNPNSTSYNSTTTFQSYIDGTIKPGTIWDVTKYFNVWLTDENSSVGLLGYSTFPASSGNTGLSAPYGTATTDGCWFWTKVCGSKTIYPSGTYDPTYCYGRTITHESGHYLGLRHTWGDGTCATDYCNDTPPEQQACYYGTTTGNSTWTYPFTNSSYTCSSSGAYNSDLGDGVMYMDFMDYSDDAFMCMFTNDQAIRMQTSLANSPNRKGPAANAVNVCSGVTTTYTTIVGAFTYPSTLCVNTAEAFTDASSGGPVTSWAWSVTPSAGVTINTSTSQNPTITFPSAATYTVTMAATNTVNTSTVSHVVTVTSCTTSSCDTISNINSADTLTVYGASQGYLSGNGLFTSSGTVTTTYTSKAIGEVYSQSTFPVNVTQVKGAMLLFYRDVAANIGTKGTSALTLKMTNTTGTGTSMVPSTSVTATQTLSLSSVVSTASTWGVDYAGNGVYNMTGYFIAYPVMFSTPVTMPSTFGLTLSLPTVSGDTAVVWSNDQYTANAAGGTGCVQLKPSNSSTLTWYNVGSAFTLPAAFGIVPIVCPATTTGIEHNELGSAINLFPNPNNGQFNFSVTLSEASNLNFTIVNMLGQVVYTKSENNITNAVLSCDLSHLAKGVYYANITDSKNNKTVKKIIIE
jgi:hypothetical protein